MTLSASLRTVLAAARALHDTRADLQTFAHFPDWAPSVNLAPQPIPAVPLVAGCTAADHPETRALALAVRAAAPLASWEQTYSEAEVGRDFLNRYGYFELLGPTGHFHSRSLRGYIAYWGPGLDYGWHAHAAEELYLCLAGAAEFHAEGRAPRILRPGESLVHDANQPHAMRTTDSPILTWVLWRGQDLGGQARMVPKAVA